MDITVYNSQLVRQGELFKITSSGWTRDVTLVLFDKELVICKRELIKRNSLVYKDRLAVDDIQVLEPLTVVDGRPHVFQLRSVSRAKCYLLACRSSQDKKQWLAAIQQLQMQMAQQHQQLLLAHHHHIHGGFPLVDEWHGGGGVASSSSSSGPFGLTVSATNDMMLMASGTLGRGNQQANKAMSTKRSKGTKRILLFTLCVRTCRCRHLTTAVFTIPSCAKPFSPQNGKIRKPEVPNF